MTIERPGTHLAALDAMRGVLAPIVVVAHAWQTFVAPTQSAEAIAFWSITFGIAAKLAVFSFFTLSGFVIALTIQRNEQRYGRFVISEFAIARAFRILPPLLLVLLITSLLEWALRASGLATPAMPLAREEFRQLAVPALKCFATLCATGTLVRDVNGPLWSLEAEVQLYVIAGLITWFLSTRKPLPLIALGLYLIAGFRPISGGTLSLQPASYLAFAAGWAAQRFEIDRTHLRLLVPAGLIGFGIAFLLMSADQRVQLNGGVWPFLAFVSYSVASAAFIRLIAGREAPGSLIFAGRFSYTLYIIHFPLLLAASFYLMPVNAPVLVAGVAAIAVVAIAAVIGLSVEQPKKQREFLSSFFGGKRGQQERTGGQS